MWIRYKNGLLNADHVVEIKMVPVKADGSVDLDNEMKEANEWAIVAIEAETHRVLVLTTWSGPEARSKAYKMKAEIWAALSQGRRWCEVF